MGKELFDFVDILNHRKKSEYYPRIADDILIRKLNSFGAVYINGPKWCGKTRTAEHVSNSALYLQDPSKTKSILLYAEQNPNRLLDGSKPRLLDEWQLAPSLWDAVRFAVDTNNSPNQFILTGSNMVDASSVLHSGAGRIAKLTMRPMSLFESKESNGEVSISSLFNNPSQNILSTSPLRIDDIAEITVRGGWPFAVKMKKSAVNIASEYIDTIINSEIFNLKNIAIQKEKFNKLLHSLARNISTQASIATLSKDVGFNSTNSLSVETVTKYLDILRRLYITEDLDAWNPSIRSKTAIRSSVTRHFSDPSIATAILNLDADALLTDFETFGLIFEDLCVRDLRVYADAINGKVFHYRDKNNLEIDAVIQLANGDWAGFEIKMGNAAIDKAATNLKRLSNSIDQTKMKAPSFLMVLTSTETAYRRSDGVYVVPIGCLRN